MSRGLVKLHLADLLDPRYNAVLTRTPRSTPQLVQSEIFMSDRKYRQHGYQDSGESKSAPRTPKPKSQDNTFGPRPLNMPGARTVSRCAQGGALISGMWDAESKCIQC